MSFFSSSRVHRPLQFADFSRSFGAVAVQGGVAAKQQDLAKWWRFSDLAAGVRTGAVMTAMSLALLQLIGG